MLDILISYFNLSFYQCCNEKDMSVTNKFLSSTENGLRHDKVAILDAGAQYGKVSKITRT